MNNQNRYVVVLHGLKAKDFKRLDELVVEAIRNTLAEENIREDVIKQYIREAGPVTFHKTKARSLISQLNRACEYMWFASEDLDPPNVLINTRVGKQASRMLGGKAGHEMTLPNEEMYKELEELSGKVIFKSEAVILNISMSFKDIRIWRKVVIPLSFSFESLHGVLQTLFGWQNYHLHEFYLFDETAIKEPQSIYSPYYTEQNYRPKLRIMSDKLLFEVSDDLPILFEKNVTLAEVVQDHSVINYLYDFGDDWKHSIKVEKIISDHFLAHSICLDGEGTAPPEDCGGESGFLEFLDIMDNPNNPQHEVMKNWAMGQSYWKFDIKFVNYFLSTFNQ